MNDNPTITMLPLAHLHDHPMRTNFLPPPLRRKLREHLSQNSLYEPLIVRPHPSLNGEFEIVHGHCRAAVLRELKHTFAACIVWELSHTQTLLYLATLNRLRGKETGRARLALLRNLHKKLPLHEYLSRLPEKRMALERIVQ